MSSVLTYRLASLGDVPLLAQMNRRLIAAEGSENPMTVGELEARMRGLLETGWSCALLELGQTSVGYALFVVRPQLYHAERREVFLRQYFIEAAFRGQGLGRSGIALLETRLFPPGAPVVLDVLSGNGRGDRFWRSVGFEPYAVTMKKLHEDREI